MRPSLLLSFLFLWFCSPGFGQKIKPSATSPRINPIVSQSSLTDSIERAKLIFEYKKHAETMALEREKINENKESEGIKAWSTGLSIIIPLLIAAGSIALGVWNQYQQVKLARETRKEQAQADFELKAAEIVLGAPRSDMALNRAIVLKALFPDRLAGNFAENFRSVDMKAKNLDEVTGLDGKKTLMDLVAANPDKADQIVEFWHKLWPGDDWLNEIRKNSRKP